MEVEDFPHLVDFDEDDEDYEEESPAVTLPTPTSSDISNLKIEDLLNINIALGQDKIIANGTEKTSIPLMVSVKEDKLAEETTLDATVDLVCLIDCSGSMDGHKLSEVQKSLIYMIELMSENDRMALISFNSESMILNSLRICTLENKRGRLRTKISDLQAIGGTNIVGGIKRALKILAKRKTKNQVASIFLLSDGNDNYEMEGLDYVLSMFDKEIGHYSIQTFGFGEDHDPDLMTNLAQRKEGSFYYIQDLTRVDEAFIDCLALLKSSLGYRVKAKVNLVPSLTYPELRFNTTYGINWKGNKEIMRDIGIGEIYLGMQKNYLTDLEFNMVKNIGDFEGVEAADIKVAEVEVIIEANSVSGGESKKYTFKKEVFITLIPSSSPQDSINENSEVHKQLLRVKGATLMQEARAFISQDRLDEARKAFDSFSVKLRRFKKLDPVLENLNQECNMASSYFRKPVQVQKSQQRGYGHYMAQRAHNYISESSNPFYNQKGLYGNRRQKKMKKALFACK